MNDYNFNAKDAIEKCVQWIKEWFDKNGKNCKAVIGISGGKDSTVAAALCVKALGADRVFGVLMPNGEQSDINDAYDVVKVLNIKHILINVKNPIDNTIREISKYYTPSEQTLINLPPRIRMATLYAVSQTVNGRVVNTCNLSEDWVGYSTRYGDSVGDFSPLSNFTVTEVKAIGHELGLPAHLVDKVPLDGLCNKTDEDNLGFTYTELDDYIRKGIAPADDKKRRIDELHEKNLFKLQLMPSFQYIIQ